MYCSYIYGYEGASGASWTGPFALPPPPPPPLIVCVYLLTWDCVAEPEFHPKKKV